MQPNTSYDLWGVPRPTLRLLHFNDVYHIEESQTEPKGGAPRFVKAMKDRIEQFKTITDGHGETIVCFSGDAFSPATLTPYTEGSEMPPILNMAQVDVAVIGNHELDRGIEVMKRRIDECNFPWLMSNIIDSKTNSIIGDVPMTHVIERAGIRVGFIGLGSQDWINTLSLPDRGRLVCKDFVFQATKLASHLRKNEHCQFVVALTHMGMDDDLHLAQNAAGVDLVLGGHDHTAVLDKRNGVYVVKSGTEFQKYSIIDIELRDEEISIYPPKTIDITPDDERDPEALQFVQEKIQFLNQHAQDIIAWTDADLDGRSSVIRTKETALGNMVADIMAKSLDVPMAFINSGSFRSNEIHTGYITSYTIHSIIPFPDKVIAVRLTGKKLLDLLEHSVKQYPEERGQFGQVSGLQFTFDGSKQPGQRLVRETVLCRNKQGEMEPLLEEKEYVFATKSFILTGGDGFPLSMDTGELLGRSESNLSDDVEKYLRNLPREKDKGHPTLNMGVEDRITILNPQTSF